LPASNKIHFFVPGYSTKGGRDMDLFDRFAGNDSWHTRRLLEYAATLTDEQLDRPLPTVVELLPCWATRAWSVGADGAAAGLAAGCGCAGWLGGCT